MIHKATPPALRITIVAVALAALAGWVLGSFLPLPLRLPPRTGQGVPILTIPAVAGAEYDIATSDGVTATLTSTLAPSARVPAAWLPDAPGHRISMDTGVDVEPDHTTITATFRPISQQP